MHTHHTPHTTHSQSITIRCGDIVNGAVKCKHWAKIGKDGKYTVFIH